MKFLADPRKRRQWVLILLKELFYVKSMARGDTLAFLTASLPAYQWPDS